MDPVRPIFTRIGTGTHLDIRNKLVKAFLKIDLSRRGQRSIFDRNQQFSNCRVRKVNPIRPLCTKIGTGTHLDTRNKPAKAVLEISQNCSLHWRGQMSNSYPKSAILGL